MNRNDWSQDHTKCMVCGWERYDPSQPEKWTLATHEIPRGIYRQAALVCPAAWLRLCNVCHEEIGDYSIWPLEWQLAIKKRGDPENYDRVMVNRLRDRQPDAITEDEVDAFVRLMAQ